MVAPRPLDPAEEKLWRAFIRVSVLLPKLLDQDLTTTGLTLSEYLALMHLSQAPRRRLRMAELAARCDLSPSRVTRLISHLESTGLVSREADDRDGRATVAALTPAGLRRLRSAWPTHAASVRARFFDELDGAAVRGLGDQLSGVADALAGQCGSLDQPPSAEHPGD